jgi:hypothetical protein
MDRSNRFRHGEAPFKPFRYAPRPVAARLLPEDRKPSYQSGDDTEQMRDDLRKRMVGATGIEPVTSAV